VLWNRRLRGRLIFPLAREVHRAGTEDALTERQGSRAGVGVVPAQCLEERDAGVEPVDARCLAVVGAAALTGVASGITGVASGITGLLRALPGLLRA
jgi:hypothetical protein